MNLIKFFNNILLKIIIKFYERKMDMDVIYATLIVKGYYTIDKVPEIIRENVEKILETLEIPGYSK